MVAGVGWGAVGSDSIIAKNRSQIKQLPIHVSTINGHWNQFDPHNLNISAQSHATSIPMPSNHHHLATTTTSSKALKQGHKEVTSPP